jgi:transcriptional regulator of PTS gene
MAQGKLGKNGSDYKTSNRALVLRMIATRQCQSRTDLARFTGLSKMTISNIVSELIEKKLLEERESEQNDAMGRNPIKLIVSSQAPKVIGVVILRSRCEAVLCDLNLNIIKRQSATTENLNAERLIHIVFQLIDTMLLDEENVISIGLVSIGPISIKKGMILHPYYFFDIENVGIVREIEERYHLPVFFDNDNQSAVLAEKLYGNGRDYEDILFVGVSEGVGCGVVSHNRFYNNRRGLPPEMGHVSIDYQGTPCVCGGRGCVECYVNSPYLLKMMQKVTGKYYTYADFCQMTDNQDVADIFADAIEKLSFAVVSSINILNPEIVIMGQDCVYWPDWCIDLLDQKINERKFSDHDVHVRVCKAYFQSDALLLGAACNAINEIYQGHFLFD